MMRLAMARCRLVWGDFDNKGNMILGWRDRRDAPGTGYSTPSEIWGAVRWKDSAKFSPNFKISDTLAEFNAAYLDKAGNDFMNITMNADTLYAVWGDVRTSKLNIWFAKTSLLTGVTGVQLLSTEQIPQIKIYPNPHKAIYILKEVL